MKNNLTIEDLYEKFSIYAFRMIAKKRYTEHEIEKKLKARGADNGICQRIIERLKELDYLDDRKFARDYIDYRVKASPRGRFLISRELRNKGINKDLLNTVLDETPVNELELAKQLVEKKNGKISKLPLIKQKSKMYQFLTSKGFTRETVYKAIELCYNPGANQDQ
ncbi:regulatory protein RecX [Candidatus Peregrinibacteria bacterium]|nr:regulatory protein RecX [Candidatus Peregrinibacteria bacterium]